MSCSEPTSYRTKMLGCASAATAMASLRNLASASGSFARCSGRTLIATSRFKRESRARYTSPMPPAPIAARISYGPSFVPAATTMIIKQVYRGWAAFEEWGGAKAVAGQPSRLRSCANLSQKGGKIKVNPSRRDLSGSQVVFVEGAARDLNPSARCVDTGKGAFMNGLETPLHGDQIISVGQVPNGMHVAREPGDERAHKIVPYGSFPLECSRRKVDYNVIRIVGENLVLVGAFPGIEILLDKYADVFWRRMDGNSLHIGSILDAALTPRRLESIHPRRAAHFIGGRILSPKIISCAGSTGRLPPSAGS